MRFYIILVLDFIRSAYPLFLLSGGGRVRGNSRVVALCLSRSPWRGSSPRRCRRTTRAKKPCNTRRCYYYIVVRVYGQGLQLVGFDRITCRTAETASQTAADNIIIKMWLECYNNNTRTSRHRAYNAYPYNAILLRVRAQWRDNIILLLYQTSLQQ